MRSGPGSRFSIVDLLSWIAVAIVGAVMFTQLTGWTATRTVAIVQTLTPYLGVCLVPVAVAAMWRRRLLLLTVVAAVGFSIAVLATPVAWPNPQPAAAAHSTGLRVAAANLWYENTRIDDVDEALADLDADVIVLSEYTPEHQAALLASPLAAEYPYRIGRSGLGAAGDALWSRVPLSPATPPATSRHSIEVIAHGPDGDVRIIAMHIPTPIVDFGGWRHDLRLAADIGQAAEGPTLLVGDLNSSYWHPDFRRMLDAGFVDAHIAAGRGFSTSWPTIWPVPPFVRLDHALTVGGLVSTDITDFEIPGSDHRGLVVTVASTPRAAP